MTQWLIKTINFPCFFCFVFSFWLLLNMSHFTGLKAPLAESVFAISNRLSSPRPTFLYCLGPKILVLLVYWVPYPWLSSKLINLYINIFKSHWSKAYICFKWSWVSNRNSGKSMKDLSDFHWNKSFVVMWWGYNLLKCVNRLKCQSGSELDALQGILGGELSKHTFQCCFILKSIVIIPSSEHWILLLLHTRFVSFECRSLLCTNWLNTSWKICGGGRCRATLSNLC